MCYRLMSTLSIARQKFQKNCFFLSRVSNFLSMETTIKLLLLLLEALGGKVMRMKG